MRSMPALSLALLSLIGPAFLSSTAWPAGFAIRNQSGLAQGNAFAGATAGAESISYMFFNPAGLTRHDGHQAETGAAYLIPEARFEDGSASTILSTPISGSDEQDDIGDAAMVPSAYVMTSLGSSFRAGLGITAPFGQTTEYDSDWIGRYHARRSKLSTININPTLAWRITPSLSFGGGLQVQYIETELSNAIDFGTIGAAAGVPGASPTTQDGSVEIDGSDWSYGYNLGLLWSPMTGTRIGVAYRSRIEHTLRGDAQFTLDEAGVGDALAASTSRFADANVSADATLPATLSIGAYQEINARWAVMGEVAWTSWSDLDELRIEVDNENEPDSVTDLEFTDTIFGALGVTWRPDDEWSVRGGLAYDQDATRDRFRTPRLPGGDRYWLSTGIGYSPTSWLDGSLSVTRIFVEDSDIALTTDGVGNQFRGNLSGRVDGDVTTIAVAITLRL